MQVSRATQLRPHDHVAGKIMDGELVAINLRTGLYYSSAGVGAVIWQLMEAGQTADAISAAVAEHFRLPNEVVHGDVAEFLDRLVTEDLIGAVEGDASEGGAAAIVYAGPYEAPSLMAFNDMEQAFAVDPPLRA
jgi:hypothetical protein